MSSPALRLGSPVKVMGRTDLKSNDTRRWQQNPHLKTSLEYVDGILDYLANFTPLRRNRRVRVGKSA